MRLLQARWPLLDRRGRGLPGCKFLAVCTILAGACRFYGGLQIGAIVMGSHTAHFSQVSYRHKFKKSTYDASRNEAPAGAERGPESAELQRPGPVTRPPIPKQNL